MRLKRLYFKNHRTDWCLDDVKFGSLTLLVGASGVGKTQILKAISLLSSVAEGRSYNGMEWSVEFEENGLQYVWKGCFGLSADKPNLSAFEDTAFAVKSESLVTGDGNEIFSRDASEIKYHGIPTVKLDPSVSAVELLKEQLDIAPVRQAFKKVNWLHLEAMSHIRFFPNLLGDINAPRSLKEIKSLKSVTPIDRLFFIQKNEPAIFEQIKETFIEIFPLVEDIDFGIEQVYKKEVAPMLKIKEKGVASWIMLPDISAGMRRAISQIVTLTLADDGEVILIDEFENGLGINCINSLADMVMDADVQIIMTSHHPYIINSIPYKDWRVVSRDGSRVTVHTANELRLGEHSRHDAFMQLIQTSTYRTGQS